MDSPSIPSLLADGLPVGFPSGFALDLAEGAKACDLLLKTAAQVLHTGTASRPSPPRPSPTSSTRTRAGRLKAATSLLFKPPQQTASNAGTRLRARKAKNFLPKKAPSNKKADSRRHHFRDAHHPAEPVSMPGDRNSSQQQ
ncbi:hypothetical protein MRX96_042726 [Rhipicephalus microplus]